MSKEAFCLELFHLYFDARAIQAFALFEAPALSRRPRKIIRLIAASIMTDSSSFVLEKRRTRCRCCIYRQSHADSTAGHSDLAENAK